MSYLLKNHKKSRYEVKPSLRILNSEMLRHLSIFYNFHVPKNPETACIMIVKFLSIQYFFCDISDWQYYYSIEEKDKNAIIIVCDVTKGFENPLKVRYYNIENEKVKTFFDNN